MDLVVALGLIKVVVVVRQLRRKVEAEGDNIRPVFLIENIRV